MLSALALFVLVAYVDVIGYDIVVQCPAHCNCRLTSSGTHLSVGMATCPAVAAPEKFHCRGTIISNGAHAIRPIIMTNALVGGPLNAVKLK